MYKTIFIEILASLSKRECTQFRKYVYSPFFNKNEKVQELCTYVLQYSPSFEHINLEKERVYTALFGQENYQELRLNNVISDTLQLLYGFLVQKQQELKPISQQIELLSVLIERNLERPIPRLVKRIEKLQNKREDQSMEYYRNATDFCEQLDVFSLTQQTHTYHASLQNASDNLDVYYWSSKLRQACEMLSRSKMIGVNYESAFLDIFLETYVKQANSFTTNPLLQVYYQTYSFLEENTQSAYDKLNELMKIHQTIFSSDELRNLYGYMLNYCIRQINFGSTKHYHEILRIYQIFVQKNILLQHGYLTKWSFINAVTAGIRSEEYTWTEAFIHNYQVHLRESERQNTVDYQLAALYFAKGNHEKTLKFLQQVEFSNILYHIFAKSIQLKVYYELGAIEAFYSLINATKNVLRRSTKLNKYHRKSYDNFVKMVKKLHDLKISITPNTSYKTKQFGVQLSNITPLANKEWLLKQYDFLIQQQS